MPKSNQQALNQLMAKVAYAIEKEAVRTCPVEKGDMKRSISVSRTSDGFEVSVGVDYARDVEYMFGSVEKPEDTWGRKQAGGYPNPNATIPFFRPSIYTVLRRLERGEL